MTDPTTPEATTRREIGFWTAAALVVGNMIGSGVFLLPATLAQYGGISMLGWLVTATGSVALALVFASLARLDQAAGGPYAYTRRAFGDLAGFLVGWGYWISTCCANAALAVAFVGYLDPFIPSIVRSPASAALLAVATMWLIVGVNMRGVRAAGRVQVTTTLIKVLPLLLIGVAGLAAFEPAHFAVPQTNAAAVGRDLMAVVTLTLWAFLGLECATVPAGAVRDPARTIPRATIVGTLTAAVIYIVSTAGVMSVVPPATLATTTAPFSDAARALFGNGVAQLVAVGAAISCLGALNGWVLMVGQLPLAIARDGLFPKVFARLSPRGAATSGMVISGVLSTLLIAMNYTGGLVALFTFAILLSTLSTLVPYVFCSLGWFLIDRRARAAGAAPRRGAAVIAAVAYIYAIGAIGGAGADVVFWGFLLMLSGLPVFVWVVRERPAPVRG